MTEPRTSIIAGLRELADVLEEHHALPIPYHLDTSFRRLMLFAHTAPEVEAAARFLDERRSHARQVITPTSSGTAENSVKVDVELDGLTVRLYFDKAHVDHGHELLRLLPIEDLRPPVERDHDDETDAIAGLEASLASSSSTAAIVADDADPETLRTVEAPLSIDEALGDVSGAEEELDDHDLDELAIMVRSKIEAGTFTDRETVELGLGERDDGDDELGAVRLNRAGLAVARRIMDRRYPFPTGEALDDLRGLSLADLLAIPEAD